MIEISYNELPEEFSEELVRTLRKMEAAQSPNWIEIYRKMAYEQEKMYLEIKSKQTKEEYEQETIQNQSHFTQDELDNQFRGWWIKFVNVDRHPSDLTLEDEIDALTNTAFYTNEKIEELFDYKAKKRLFIRRNHLNTTELFSFFWVTKSPFSQWHISSFIAPSFLFASDDEKPKLLTNQIPFDVLEFTSAEQFMMYQKAMLFLDREIALLIMKTNDVRRIKELGRMVRNFNEDVWYYNRSKIVYEGNKAKFTQNESLKKALFATKGTTLVEAAPNDKIWGIGLAEDDPRVKQRETWQGKNLLGEILTELRVDLMGDY